MWLYLCLFCYFASTAVAEYSSNYFCADMQPQIHVDIQQLMGMWYGVEKIDHRDERHFSRVVPACPIIHLSEDQPPTINPLYKTNRYGYGYGQDQPYGTHIAQSQYPRTQQDINRAMQDRSEYDKRTTYANYPATRMHQDWIRQNREFKYIRLFWDENGDSISYHLRYNISQPGFWISSGPENGANLKSQFSHFAGTIQVIKAVGNHMVLTFCHQLPEAQLYSILLSREAKLKPSEIHSVHSMLNRKGLDTHAVKKVCNSAAGASVSSTSLIFAIILSFVCRILKRDLLSCTD